MSVRVGRRSGEGGKAGVEERDMVGYDERGSSVLIWVRHRDGWERGVVLAGR